MDRKKRDIQKKKVAGPGRATRVRATPEDSHVAPPSLCFRLLDGNQMLGDGLVTEDEKVVDVGAFPHLITSTAS